MLGSVQLREASAERAAVGRRWADVRLTFCSLAADAAQLEARGFVEAEAVGAGVEVRQLEGLAGPPEWSR